MTNIHDRINEKCNAFADDIAALVKEALLSAFDKPATQQAQARGIPARAGRPPGSKRTPEELADVTDAVYSAIRRNPGLRIEQLSDKLSGVQTKELMLPIIRLKAQKCLIVKGQRRGTRYWAR